MGGEQDGQLRTTLGVGGARFGELLLSSHTTPGIIEHNFTQHFSVDNGGVRFNETPSAEITVGKS